MRVKGLLDTRSLKPYAAAAAAGSVAGAMLVGIGKAAGWSGPKIMLVGVAGCLGVSLAFQAAGHASELMRG